MYMSDMIQKCKDAKGLNVSLLESGTKLLVETMNSFYELEILEGKLVNIFGGTRQDGTVRFKKPTQAVVVGSTYGGSMIKVDWIGEDMRMEVHIVGSDHRKSLSTSPVQRITIEAPKGDWSYTLK